MSTTTRRGTRDRILDAAEHLIVETGYAATSVDRILAEVGITKGAFFYHFKSKAAMARALVERNAAQDLARLGEFAARARQLSPDPLQSLLVFLGLWVEVAEQLQDGPVPGCLFVSFAAEAGQFDAEVMDVLEHVVVAWRETLTPWLEEIAAAHPPARAVEPTALADMLTVVFEGSFTVARMLQDNRVFLDQMRLYRTYVELLHGA